MYGVILWSDMTDRKAVIWCEDQGALAYLAGRRDAGPFFDTGDFIEFDLMMDAGLRKASYARLVVPEMYPDLPEDLRRAVAEGVVENALNVGFLRLVGTPPCATSQQNPFVITDDVDEQGDVFEGRERFATGRADQDLTNVVAFRCT